MLRETKKNTFVRSTDKKIQEKFWNKITICRSFASFASIGSHGKEKENASLKFNFANISKIKTKTKLL